MGIEAQDFAVLANGVRSFRVALAPRTRSAFRTRCFGLLPLRRGGLPFLPLRRGEEKGSGKRVGQSGDDEKLIELTLWRGYHPCRHGVQLSRPGSTVELPSTSKVAVKEAVCPCCTHSHFLILAFLVLKNEVAVVAIVLDDLNVFC